MAVESAQNHPSAEGSHRGDQRPPPHVGVSVHNGTWDGGVLNSPFISTRAIPGGFAIPPALLFMRGATVTCPSEGERVALGCGKGNPSLLHGRPEGVCWQSARTGTHVGCGR